MYSAIVNSEATTRPSDDGLASKLGKLGEEFALWHKQSRAGLYQILTGCLELVVEIKKDTDLGKELDGYLASKNFKTDNRTTIYHKVVKSMVGKNQDTRVCRYSLVLKKADNSGVDPAGLAKWIEANGGIAKLNEREPKATPSHSPKTTDHSDVQQRRIQRGKRRVEKCTVLGKFDRITGIPAHAELVVLLGKVTSDGKIELLEFSPDQTVLNDILRAAGEEDSAVRIDADCSSTTDNVTDMSVDRKADQKKKQAA